MVPAPRRIKSGIDSTEKDLQVRRNQVRDAPVDRGQKIGPSGFSREIQTLISPPTLNRALPNVHDSIIGSKPITLKRQGSKRSLCVRIKVLRSEADGITFEAMSIMTLKLPETLRRDLEAEAQRRGITKSAVVRDCLEAMLRRKQAKKRVSCLDLVGDLVGTQPGPRDASVNGRYLEEAIVADHGAIRKNSR